MIAQFSSKFYFIYIHVLVWTEICMLWCIFKISSMCATYEPYAFLYEQKLNICIQKYLRLIPMLHWNLWFRSRFSYIGNLTWIYDYTRFGYFDFRQNFLNLSRNGAILPKILCRIQIWVSKIEIQIGQNFKHLKKDKKFEKILYTELLQII